MPNNPSDNEVTTAVLMANASSGTFRSDLATFLSKQVPKATEDLSFTGGNYGFTGIDDFSFSAEKESNFLGIGKGNGFLGLFPKKDTTGAAPAPVLPSQTAEQKRQARITEDNPTGKTQVGLLLAQVGGALKDTLLDKENLNAGIQLGLQSLANKTQAEQNALQKQSLVLQNVQDQMKQNLPAGANATKSNTMVYVWVGVGVVAVTILGILIYKRTKK